VSQENFGMSFLEMIHCVHFKGFLNKIIICNSLPEGSIAQYNPSPLNTPLHTAANVSYEAFA